VLVWSHLFHFVLKLHTLLLLPSPLPSFVSLCLRTAPPVLFLISIKMPLHLDSYLRINQRTIDPVARSVERPIWKK